MIRTTRTLSTGFSQALAGFIAAACFAGSALAAPKTIRIDIDGLVCAFCAQGIEKKLKKHAATDKVFVSLEQKVVLVKLKEGQDIADDKVKADITDAGYALRGIVRRDEAFEKLRDDIKAKKP